jgi:hypothetical protein
MWSPFSFKAAVDAAIANAAPSLDHEQRRVVLEAVLEALASVDANQSFTDAIHAQVKSAAAASALRDDLYESVEDSGVMARVAANAVLGVLADGGEGAEEGSDAVVGRRVATMSYKGWEFRYVRLPDETRAVRVVATLDDVHRPGRRFRTSRVEPVRSTVEAAAFRAVMQVEEHEARERFEIGRAHV